MKILTIFRLINIIAVYIFFNGQFIRFIVTLDSQRGAESVDFTSMCFLKTFLGQLKFFKNIFKRYFQQKIVHRLYFGIQIAPKVLEIIVKNG